MVLQESSLTSHESTPRVIAKSKSQNVITTPLVLAKSNFPKRKRLEAPKSNVYNWLVLLLATTTGAPAHGPGYPHPRRGPYYYEVNIVQA